MYYTLASCNPAACGMPKRVKGLVGPMIDQGMADKAILESMEKTLGAKIWRPRLLR